MRSSTELPTAVELAQARVRALETLQQTCDRRRRAELEALVAELDARLSEHPQA